MARKKEPLKIIFLGKKPIDFDPFLLSFKERIQDGQFFGDKLKNFEVSFVFISNLPRKIPVDFIKEVFYREGKKLIINFGKVSEQILFLVRSKPDIEINFYSISSRMKRGARKIICYKNKKTKSNFIKIRDYFMNGEISTQNISFFKKPVYFRDGKKLRRIAA